MLHFLCVLGLVLVVAPTYLLQATISDASTLVGALISTLVSQLLH